MTSKPTYKELEQRIKELEKDSVKTKRTKEKLEQENKRMEVILSALDTGLSLINPDMTIAWVNQKVRDMFPGSEPVGQLCHVFYESRETICENCQTLQAFISGKICENERLVPTTDKWYYIIAQPIKDRTGKVVNVLEGIADVTERKQIEEVLRESEKRHRTLFETMIQGVVYQDAEGNIISANHAAVRILGLTLDQMRGRTSIDPRWKSIHEDGSDFSGETHPSMVALKKGEKIENVIMGVFNPSMGDHTWININAVPLFREGENKPYQVYTTFHDITERMKAVEALQESEERYRILFELSPDAIVIWQDEEVVFANSAAMSLLGATTLDQLVGLSIWGIHHSDYHTQLKERYQHAHETGLTLPPIEYQFVRLDRQIIYVEATGTLIQYRNQPSNVGVYRDITERRQLEAEKAKLETRLQQAQKMEAIGTLAGGIAHDFNNILASVIGYTELAFLDSGKGTQQQNSLQNVLIAGNRAKDLVKQILTFSRQTDQEQKPVQLKLVVKEALKLLRASIPSTIEIEKIIESDSLVLGDPTQIHQVFMNLCTNATHAMREQGGVLTVSLSDEDLDSESNPDYPGLKPGAYINLTVSDTGHGITSDNLKKIFDPFFSTKEKGEGTGMGLSVVHGIVQSHGGAVYVHSEPGKGSTFKVFLPVIERLLEPEDMIERPLLTGTEHILFIDDEPAIVDMGKKTLESLGYDVVTRTSSIEALELFRAQKSRYDLVITDMTMPHMTGIDLAKELMSIRPGIPIILCTGFSEKIDENRAKKIGLRAFVLKPILRREIANTIREVLDKK